MNVAALLQDSPSDDRRRQRDIPAPALHLPPPHDPDRERTRDPDRPTLPPPVASPRQHPPPEPHPHRYHPTSPPPAHRPYQPPPPDYPHPPQRPLPPSSFLPPPPFDHSKHRRPDPEPPRQPDTLHGPPPGPSPTYASEHRSLPPPPRPQPPPHTHHHHPQHAHTLPSTPSAIHMHPPARPPPVHSASMGQLKGPPSASPPGPGIPPPGHTSIPLYPTHVVGPGMPPPHHSPHLVHNPSPGSGPRGLHSPHYMEPSPMYAPQPSGPPAQGGPRSRPSGLDYGSAHASPVMAGLRSHPPFDDRERERAEREREHQHHRDRSRDPSERERDLPRASGPRAPPAPLGAHPGSAHHHHVGHGPAPMQGASMSLNARPPLQGPGLTGQSPTIQKERGARDWEREMEREQWERDVERERMGRGVVVVGESPGAHRDRERGMAMPMPSKESLKERERDFIERPRGEREGDAFRPPLERPGPAPGIFDVDERDHRRGPLQGPAPTPGPGRPRYPRSPPRTGSMPIPGPGLIDEEREREIRERERFIERARSEREKALRLEDARRSERDRFAMAEALKMRAEWDIGERERIERERDIRERERVERERERQSAAAAAMPGAGRPGMEEKRVAREREERRVKEEQMQLDEQERVQRERQREQRRERELERAQREQQAMERERERADFDAPNIIPRQGSRQQAPPLQPQPPHRHHSHIHLPPSQQLSKSTKPGAPGPPPPPPGGPPHIQPGMHPRDGVFGFPPDHVAHGRVPLPKGADGPPPPQAGGAPPHGHPPHPMANVVHTHPHAPPASGPGPHLAHPHRQTPPPPPGYGPVPPPQVSSGMVFVPRSPSPRRPPTKPPLPPIMLGTFVYPHTPFPFVDFPSAGLSPGAEHDQEPRELRAVVFIPAGFLPTRRPAPPRLWGGALIPNVPALSPPRQAHLQQQQLHHAQMQGYAPHLLPPLSLPHADEFRGFRRVYTDDSDLFLCVLHAGWVSWSGARRARREGRDLRVEVRLTSETRFIGGFGQLCGRQGGQREARDGEDDGSSLLSAGWGNSHDGAGIEILDAVFVKKGTAHAAGLRNRKQRLAEYAERRSVVVPSENEDAGGVQAPPRKRRRLSSAPGVLHESNANADAGEEVMVEYAGHELCAAFTLTFGSASGRVKDVRLRGKGRARDKASSPADVPMPVDGAPLETLPLDGSLSPQLGKRPRSRSPAPTPASPPVPARAAHDGATARPQPEAPPAVPEVKTSDVGENPKSGSTKVVRADPPTPIVAAQEGTTKDEDVVMDDHKEEPLVPPPPSPALDASSKSASTLQSLIPPVAKTAEESAC